MDNKEQKFIRKIQKKIDKNLKCSKMLKSVTYDNKNNYHIETKLK